MSSGSNTSAANDPGSARTAAGETSSSTSGSSRSPSQGRSPGASRPAADRGGHDGEDGVDEVGVVVVRRRADRCPHHGQLQCAPGLERDRPEVLEQGMHRVGIDDTDAENGERLTQRVLPDLG